MPLQLPEAFCARMKQMLGPQEYESFLRSYSRPRQRGLRVNTLKISPEKFEQTAPFPVQRIPWIPNGFFYEEDVHPAQHPYYAAGLYYLQEPSAMTPASVLPVRPGGRVLDLCAAPGGKATELGARLRGEGLLVANDISNARAKALLRNLELFGVRNALVTNETPERLAEAFPCFFDSILVDAPCSGEGMFRKNPEAAELWSPGKVRDCAAMQREILRQAYRMLRPGGYLLYSTCTFSPEEDEQMAEWLLSSCPDLRMADTGLDVKGEEYGFSAGKPEWLSVRTGADAVPAAEDPGLHDAGTGQSGRQPAAAKCIRIWPHRMPGEGHFLALFRREESAAVTEACFHSAGWGSGEKEQTGEGMAQAREGRDKAGRSKGQDRKRRADTGKNRQKVSESCPDREQMELIAPFLHFLPQTADTEKAAVPGRIEARGGRAYLVQALPESVRGLHFLRNGLYLGEWKKKRFEPSQPLALAQDLLLPDCKTDRCDFSAEDPRLTEYLNGGQILLTEQEAENSPDGWCLVCVTGFPLGWGKKTGAAIKNKYPAAWR